MKRSERKRYWQEQVAKPGAWIQLPPGMELAFVGGYRTHESLVEGLLRYEEEAGVKWDPEEEPLPERIGYSEDRHCRVLPNQGEIIYGAMRAAIIPVEWRGGKDEQAQRIIQEAVRRYNAFPELRRRIDYARKHTCDFTQAYEYLDREISRILDGQ